MSNLTEVMKPEVMLELLENAAEQLHVRVSYESLSGGVVGGHGGLCKVKGEFRCIIDKRATAEERVVTLATALARFDLSQLETSDKVREVIRTYELSSKHRRTAA
jgi:hypothetical protein